MDNELNDNEISQKIIKIVFESSNYILPDTITNLSELEKFIFHNVLLYGEKRSDDILLEQIFHMIQIWGGVMGRLFYTKPNTNGNFSIIQDKYKTIVNACIDFHLDISNEKSQVIFKKLESLIYVVKENKLSNIGPSFLTKHIRFWTYYNLKDNALPVYDDTMAYYYTKKVIPRENYIPIFWDKIIGDAIKSKMTLIEYERFLLNRYKKQQS